MRTHLIYGTDTGNTRSVAKKIAKALPEATVIHIDKAETLDFENCEFLILGAPTCGYGDLSTDWEDGMAKLDRADLTGKTVALFGTGDQVNYPDTFVDAMGILYDKVLSRGGKVVGRTSTSGYQFDGSTALRNGDFVGLVLDQDNQPEKTDARIAAWVGGLK